MANKDEHWLSKQLKKELKTIPNVFVQQYIATPQTGRGNPDFLLVVEGIPLFVELKHPTDFTSVPRPEQLIVHQKIRDAGGYVLVSRTTKRVIDAIDYIQCLAAFSTPVERIVIELQHAFGKDGMDDLDKD